MDFSFDQHAASKMAGSSWPGPEAFEAGAKYLRAATADEVQWPGGTDSSEVHRKQSVGAWYLAVPLHLGFSTPPDCRGDVVVTIVVITTIMEFDGSATAFRENGDRFPGGERVSGSAPHLRSAVPPPRRGIKEGRPFPPPVQRAADSARSAGRPGVRRNCWPDDYSRSRCDPSAGPPGKTRADRPQSREQGPAHGVDLDYTGRAQGFGRTRSADSGCPSPATGTSRPEPVRNPGRTLAVGA